jgi:aryl-alcohol dehydrogenase-like predicted oxidoreductase
MKYTHLGRTGLVVSRLCLGTMNFGTETSENDSFKIMDNALDLGINLFDTANIYGWKLGEGITEQIIGQWLSQGASRREKIILTTKVYCPMGTEPNDRGLSARHICHACEESLRRLKTDYIDIYFMHHIDRGTTTPEDRRFGGWSDENLIRSPYRIKETPWDEIWQALELLVRQGKVLYIGSSNFAGWNIVQACEKAYSRNFLGLVCEQSVYNLSNRMLELEVIPVCREYGLGLLIWSPLAGGLLAGVLNKPTVGRRAHIKDLVNAHMSKISAYEHFCKEIGEKPADVALAWLLKNTVVTSTIIGPRTLNQLSSCLKALEIHLDDIHINKLDKIWPGPGGPAPEAYAW